MKKFVSLVLAMSLVVSLIGCATPSHRTKSGAGIGAILGGVAGGAIDHKNRWRGGVIGAAAGALIGAAIGNILDRAAYEAANENKTVVYTRMGDDGVEETVKAIPQGSTAEGDYKIVKTQVIRDGEVVKEEIRRVPIESI